MMHWPPWPSNAELEQIWITQAQQTEGRGSLAEVSNIQGRLFCHPHPWVRGRATLKKTIGIGLTPWLPSTLLPIASVAMV